MNTTPINLFSGALGVVIVFFVIYGVSKGLK